MLHFLSGLIERWKLRNPPDRNVRRSVELEGSDVE
jgi:hypothetical protein